MRVRDLDDAEYQRRMESLSRTFDMASRVLTSRGPSELDSFMAKYNIHDTCPRAVIRFIQGDLAAPAAAPGASTGVSAAVASSITHHLINLLDLLELEMTATDEVLPVLKELQQEVNKLVRRTNAALVPATFSPDASSFSVIRGAGDGVQGLAGEGDLPEVARQAHDDARL